MLALAGFARRCAARRPAGDRRPRAQPTSRRSPPWPRRPAADLYWAGRADSLRRSGRHSPATTGVRRVVLRAAIARHRRRHCRRRRSAGRARRAAAKVRTANGRSTCCGELRRRCCGTAMSPTLSRRRARPNSPRLFGTLRPRVAASVGRTAAAASHRGRDRPAPDPARGSCGRIGEPGRIRYRRRGARPRRVVYSSTSPGRCARTPTPAAARAHRWCRGLPRSVEVFTIGTRLTRVTTALRSATPTARRGRRATSCPTGPAAPGWARCSRCSWTDGGSAVRRGGAVVVVFSDGWERGDAASLGASRCGGCAGLAHRVVWVNPHRGKRGVRACAGGASSRYCRTCDDLVAGHSPDDASRRCRRWWPMRDVLPSCCAWWRAGESVGVGTVVATLRSAPRPPGASMLVGPGRRGGRKRVRRLRRGRGLRARRRRSWSPGQPVLQRYGVSDDDAFAVGLTCGGILDVFVEKVDRRPSPSWATWPPTSTAGPPGRRRNRGRPPRPSAARPPPDRPPRGRPPCRRERSGAVGLGSGSPRGRCGGRRRPWPAGRRADRDARRTGPDGRAAR